MLQGVDAREIDDQGHDPLDVEGLATLGRFVVEEVPEQADRRLEQQDVAGEQEEEPRVVLELLPEASAQLVDQPFGSVPAPEIEEDPGLEQVFRLEGGDPALTASSRP